MTNSMTFKQLIKFCDNMNARYYINSYYIGGCMNKEEWFTNIIDIVEVECGDAEITYIFVDGKLDSVTC